MSAGQKKKLYGDELRKQYEDAFQNLSSDTDDDVPENVTFGPRDSDDSGREDAGDVDLEEDMVLSDTGDAAHSDDEMPVVLHTKKFAFAIKDDRECPRIECVDRATGSPIAPLKALSMFARRLRAIQSAEPEYSYVNPNVCYSLYVLHEVSCNPAYRGLLTEMSGLTRDGIEVSDIDYKGFSMSIPVDDKDVDIKTSKILRVNSTRLTMPILFYDSPTGVVLLRHKNNCATMKVVPASEHASEIKLFMLCNKSLLSSAGDDQKPIVCPKTHWYDHILKRPNDNASVSSSDTVWKRLFRNVFGDILDGAPESPLAVYLTDLITRTMSSQKKSDVGRRGSVLQREKGSRTAASPSVKKQSALAFGVISRDVSSVARSIVAPVSSSVGRSGDVTVPRSGVLSSGARPATVAKPPPVAMSPELRIDSPADQPTTALLVDVQSHRGGTKKSSVVDVALGHVDDDDHVESVQCADQLSGSIECDATTPTRQLIVPGAPKKAVKRKGEGLTDEITCVKKLCFGGGNNRQNNMGTFVLYFRQAPFVSYRMFDQYNVIGVDCDANDKHAVTMTGTFDDFIGATTAFKSLPVVVLGWSFNANN